MTFIIAFVFSMAGNGENNAKDEGLRLPLDAQGESLSFTFRAASVNCKLKAAAVHSNDSVAIFSDNQALYDKMILASSLEAEKKVHNVDLDLNNHHEHSITKTITRKLFSFDSEVERDEVEVSLPRNVPLDLKVEYAIGDATFDLSHLDVQNFYVRSGGADLFISYEDSIANTFPMDTFMVNVDMGAVYIDKLSYTKAKNIITKVSFGSLFLDFSHDNWNEGGTAVSASVGAGKMIVKLPSEDIPILVKYSTSPLCRVVNNAKEVNMESVGTKSYANAAYMEDPSNAIIFDVKLAMGSLMFVGPEGEIVNDEFEKLR
ncbi:hypothetical protein [Aureibacter tunicatorum]|uniref:Uncharacterized protein n=1 Tax=Aureibacter tunicatorum TaxID=866807 RepID=A0AAE4BPJ7_9BACT|nr:hypothetical protein [Aureibacter tunicatorum]MDR6238059.1 hypothetical protein [Aureibacter tunicatorum]